MTNQLAQAEPAVDAWAARISAHLQDTAGEPERLADLRLSAAAAFQRLGLPTSRQELWKHTSLAPILRTAWGVPEPDFDGGLNIGPVQAAARIPGLPGQSLVFVDGHYRASLSAFDPPYGTTISPMQHIPAGIDRVGNVAAFDADAFVALNTALFADAAIVVLGADTSIEKPVHIVHISTAGAQPMASHPRTLISVGPGSKVTVVESFVTLATGPQPDGEAGADLGSAAEAPPPTFANAVTEISVGANAKLDYIRLQRDTASGHIIHAISSRVDEGGTLNTYNACLGSPLARVNLSIRLDGEQAHAGLFGLVLAGGDDHVDNHTHLDHAVPHCTSHELYKHVLDGRAHGVFYGRIVVHPDAQKTDADQGNHTLLLSRDAHIDAMPQLEIRADDVRCTHGATSGPADGETLFYLQSRGLSPTAATTLLTQGFAGEVIDIVPLEPVREFLTGELIARLAQRLD